MQGIFFLGIRRIQEGAFQFKVEFLAAVSPLEARGGQFLVLWQEAAVFLGIAVAGFCCRAVILIDVGGNAFMYGFPFCWKVVIILVVWIKMQEFRLDYADG